MSFRKKHDASERRRRTDCWIMPTRRRLVSSSFFPRFYSPRTRGVLPRHVASTPCETNDTLGGVPRTFPFDLCARCALPLLPAGCPEGVATIPRFKSRYIMAVTALPLVNDSIIQIDYLIILNFCSIVSFFFSFPLNRYYNPSTIVGYRFNLILFSSSIHLLFFFIFMINVMMYFDVIINIKY